MLKKVLFLFAAAAILTTGCADPEKGPILTQETLLFGAFPFLNELKTAEFDLADLSGSAYEMDVYFVDNEGGTAVAQYNLYVSFDDNNPDNGDLSTPSTLYKSFGPSDFSTLGSKGNLGMTVRIPFSEIASFVGAGAAGAVVSGDRFQFRGEIRHSDGRVFSSANSTPAIVNAFGGIWNFNVNATCPLVSSDFAGAYKVRYGTVYDAFPLFGAPVQPFGPAPLSLDVTLSTVSGSTTRRSLNFGPYLRPGYNFGTSDVTLEFACDKVTSTNINSGAGCGGGSIQASQTGVAAFTLADDTTWEIEYLDFKPDGGCGVSEMPFSLVFTKQ